MHSLEKCVFRSYFVQIRQYPLSSHTGNIQKENILLQVNSTAFCSASQASAAQVHLVLQNNLIRMKDKGIEGMHSKQVSYEMTICSTCLNFDDRVIIHEASKPSARESIDDVASTCLGFESCLS